MATQYDYSLIYAPLSFQMTPLEFEVLDANRKAVAIARPLGQVTDEITKALAPLPEGDWEAVSHDLIPFGASLGITFLIRRPKMGEQGMKRRR